MTQTACIRVRATDDVKSALERLAAKEQRTLSNVVRMAIEDYLERQGY